MLFQTVWSLHILNRRRFSSVPARVLFTCCDPTGAPKWNQLICVDVWCMHWLVYSGNSGCNRRCGGRATLFGSPIFKKKSPFMSCPDANRLRMINLMIWKLLLWGRVVPTSSVCLMLLFSFSFCGGGFQIWMSCGARKECIPL